MTVGVSGSSKKGAYTKRDQSSGTKQIVCDYIRMGEASDIGKAPPNRVYSRDYAKSQPDPYVDTVSPFLGNPLRW